MNLKVQYSIILLVFIAIAFLSVKAMAEELQCGRCGKTIQGQYVSYSLDGNKKLLVCQKCDKQLLHCKACGLPFHNKDLVKIKGEILCKPCYDNSIFCNICNRRINGKYYQSKDGSEKYCSHCYNRYPRCAVCDRPGNLHRLDGGKSVCDECLAKLPLCGSCGKPIVGTYYKFDSSDQLFCEKCKNHNPKCYSCGVPLGKQHFRFDDGRRVCINCNNRAVYDVEQIKQIMAEVEQLCVKHLGLKVNTPYQLQIKPMNSKSSIQANKAKKGENGDSPLFGKELGLYRRLNGKSEIFLLYGLPKEMLYDTAAHEYAHAWQSENCINNQSLEILEGFAQWVSSQILHIKNFPKTLEHLEARTDNPYGTGYHKVKSLEQRMGKVRMIEYIKKVK